MRKFPYRFSFFENPFASPRSLPHPNWGLALLRWAGRREGGRGEVKWLHSGVNGTKESNSPGWKQRSKGKKSPGTLIENALGLSPSSLLSLNWNCRANKNLHILALISLATLRFISVSPACAHASYAQCLNALDKLSKNAKIAQINYTRQHETHKSYAQTLNYELKWTAVRRMGGVRGG